MTTIGKLAAAAALALGMTASTQAALHFDIDVIGVELSAGNPCYTGTFNITGPGLGKGFDPSTMTIVSAYATFALWDSALFGGTENVTVDLGGEAFDQSGPFLGAILLGDQVLGDVLLDLQEDGELAYTVTRVAGSFQLVGAELHAKSVHSHEVPDSGWTLGLLGAGLIGVAAIRRR